jgi:hypothetical protein
MTGSQALPFLFYFPFTNRFNNSVKSIFGPPPPPPPPHTPSLLPRPFHPLCKINVTTFFLKTPPKIKKILGYTLKSLSPPLFVWCVPPKPPPQVPTRYLPSSAR